MKGDLKRRDLDEVGDSFYSTMFLPRVGSIEKKKEKKAGKGGGSAASFEHKFCWSLNMGE